MTLKFKSLKEDFVKGLEYQNSRHQTNFLAKVKPWSVFLLLASISLIEFLAGFHYEITFSAAVLLFFAITSLQLNKSLDISRAYSSFADKYFLEGFTEVYTDKIYINIKSESSETKIKLTIIESFEESADFFIILFKTGNFILFPKNQLNDFELNAFIKELEENYKHSN